MTGPRVLRLHRGFGSSPASVRSIFQLCGDIHAGFGDKRGLSLRFAYNTSPRVEAALDVAARRDEHFLLGSLHGRDLVRL